LLRVDWLALVFAAFVVVYAVIPQSVLGGGATHKGVLYGTRHDLLPVLAYFLGRGLELTAPGGELTVLPTYTAMLALQRLVADRGLAKRYWERAA